VKVLVLSRMYPQPGREHYGVFVHEPLRLLAARGHAVRVIAPVPRTPPGLATLHPAWRRLARLPSRRELDGIPVDHPRYLLLPRALDLAGAARRMARAVLALPDLDGFDLLHAHFGLPDGAAARRVAERLGIPYLVTSHGSDVLRLANRSPSAARAIHGGFAGAARVIMVSEAARRRAEALNLPVARATVLWNGYDASRFLATAPPPAAAGPLRVVCVANLVPSKRVDVLLAAAAAARERGADLRLHVIGSGSEADALARLAAASDLPVEWTAGLDRDALAAALRRAAVFALPAEGESFGIVYLEAMASGLATLAVAGEGIADVIADGEDGLLLPAGDVAAWSDALVRLARDPALRARLGEGGIRRARGLGWEGHVEALADIYAEVLAERHGRPSAAGDGEVGP